MMCIQNGSKSSIDFFGFAFLFCENTTIDDVSAHL
jgi:hypothetical protein